MSTTTITSTQLAEQADEAKASHEMALTVGKQLAESVLSENATKDARRFEQCRIAYAGFESGAKDAEVASALSEAILSSIQDKARRSVMAETGLDQGGAKVSRVTIVQRRSAWSDLIAAGVTPTEESVKASFKLASSGAKGLGDMRKNLQADTLKQPKARRENYFIAQAYKRFSALTNAAAEARAEAAALRASEDKAEGTTTEVSLDSASDVATLILAEVSRPWSDDDKATLAAALEKAYAVLTGNSIPDAE